MPMTKTRKADQEPPQDGGEQFRKPASLEEEPGGEGASEHGLPPEGFDFGNSPSRIADLDLRGRDLIHRTGAGTQGIVRSEQAEHGEFEIWDLRFRICDSQIPNPKSQS
jgi:hypothetical protein